MAVGEDLLTLHKTRMLPMRPLNPYFWKEMKPKIYSGLSMLLFPTCVPIAMRGMEKRKRNVVRVADPTVLTRAVGFGEFCLRLQTEDLEFE